jgi:uncharacterized membrane protein
MPDARPGGTPYTGSVMIVYLALGVLVLAVGLWLVRAFAEADTRELARGLRQAGVVLGALLSGAVFILGVASERGLLVFVGACGMGWVGYSLWRRRSQGTIAGGTALPPRSEVETEFVKMRIDHDGGTLSGTVLKGRLRGRGLGELSRDQLVRLWRECRPKDQRTASLLEAYLDRFMPSWRQHAIADDTAPVQAEEAMTAEEALAVLGLTAGAAESEIREAYHRLMIKMQPEEGGSPYLAAKLKEARDLLLKN